MLSEEGFYRVEGLGAPIEPCYCESLAIRCVPNRWSIAIHCHRTLAQLLWLQKGEAACLGAHGEEACVADAALIVVPPGVAHGYRFVPGADGWVVTLPASLWYEWMTGREVLAGAAVRIFPAYMLDGVKLAFSGLVRFWQRSAGSKHHGLLLWLQTLLTEVAQLFTEAAEAGWAQRRAYQVVGHFLALAQIHHQQWLPIPWYARQLGVSQRLLSRYCREVLGCSPGAALDEVRWREAQRALAERRGPLMQVAAELGFFRPGLFQSLGETAHWSCAVALGCFSRGG